MISLEGKTAIITGGAGGLGKAIAHAFVLAKANVVICDINIDRLQKTEKELSSFGAIAGIEADVTSEDAVKDLFDESIARFGRIDIVVNNAGIMDHFDPVGTTEKTVWDRVLAVNLTAPYLISKFAVEHMLTRQFTSGVILNVGSVGGVRGWAAGAAYTASKHGLVGLTKNTAAFYSKKGIRCNLILPGGMLTKFGEGETFQAGPNHEGYHLMELAAAMEPDRSGLEEMSSLCLYLCSDQSSVVNGAVISADKGWTSY
ncbi:MAG: hypothetical protein M1834_000544 [Cirrosporium novae-zelandiae]|nr:MAG: hypothetical protein M1834_000544 [Cirrosporium novae-zelandiae]